MTSDLKSVLLAELETEIATTKRHLARVPAEHWAWRPHAKSSTLGMLAAHLVDCVRWIEPVFANDEYDIDPKTYRPASASSPEHLLALFDEEAAKAMALVGASNAEAILATWRFKIGGRPRWEKPRLEAVRDLAFNHLVHHRGQLTVYLRLLDVPLAWTYGPTADS